MANRFAHNVEELDRITVHTVKELQDALGALQGSGRDDRFLDGKHFVTLLCETLSDGSEQFEVLVRPAKEHQF